MRTRRQFLSIIMTVGVFALSSVAVAHANTRWYVKSTATGTGTGLSWTNAFTTVSAAITAASPTRDAQGHSDEIWVAKGNYFPPVVGSTSNGFVINKPLKLYGGFRGDETSLQNRAGFFVSTILDGNINNPNLFTDNAYHVVNISGVTSTSGDPGVLIDGFLIRNGGRATSQPTNTPGAGIIASLSDLDLANCFVRSNLAGGEDGGGLWFTSGSGGLYPTVGYILHIKKCEFKDDHAYQGGGMFIDEAAGEVVNTQFLENGVSPYGAGAFVTRMGTDNQLGFTNCVFWANDATSVPSLGAGLYLGEIGGDSGGRAQVVNCTFSDNTCSSSSSGEAMAISTNSSATIYNSIFYFNNSNNGTIAPIAGPATVGYSDVEGGWSGTGNISGDPKFADHSNGLLTLLLTSTPPSPCLDAADYSRVPADDLDLDGDGNLTEPIPLDLAGQLRLFNQTTITDSGAGSSSCSSCTYLDMGAYELP
jgi:hypothetical protein